MGMYKKSCRQRIVYMYIIVPGSIASYFTTHGGAELDQSSDN